MNTTDIAHDMSPPDTLTMVGVIEDNARALNLEQLGQVRGKLERDYRQAVEALEPHIERAVTESRIDGASWDTIGNLLAMHKDTARRTYQDVAVTRGAPGPRLERCGMQHTDPAGWCRNGVAGVIELKRKDGPPGPGVNVCREHGEKLVKGRKYAWRVAPEPVRKGRHAREVTE